MTDKEKNRKEVERLMTELIQEKKKGYSSNVDDACILELQNVLTYIDSLPEEKKPIRKYVSPEDNTLGKLYKEAMEELEEKITLYEKNHKKSVSNGLEQAANDYVGHAPEIDEDLSVYSNREAFKAGAQWQKEQMIDKACKWLKSYRQDTPDGTGYMAGIVNDKTIEEFKQAMEE